MLYKPLGIQVYKYYLHWAPKSVNITYIGLFGSVGNCTISEATALIAAAFAGGLDPLRKLLEAKADVEERSSRNH